MTPKEYEEFLIDQEEMLVNRLVAMGNSGDHDHAKLIAVQMALVQIRNLHRRKDTAVARDIMEAEKRFG